MELQVFNNTEFGSVRTATVNGEVMFVGKDVADILGYQNGSRDINRHVDEEDRHKVMLFDGNQDKETIIINESGLYSLILSSKMPNAKKFKHWVTAEVLRLSVSMECMPSMRFWKILILRLQHLHSLKKSVREENSLNVRRLFSVSRLQRCSQRQATMTLFYRTRTQFLLHRLQRTMV